MNQKQNGGNLFFAFILVVGLIAITRFTDLKPHWGSLEMKPTSTITVSGLAKKEQSNQIANFTAGMESIETSKEEALNKAIQVDIGWGHLKDINEIKNVNLRISPTEISEKLQTQSWYEAVSKLICLRGNYDNLHLKLIGTHEKFLICDNSWALITSHNFLTSGSDKDEREIGLWTNDENIISELIQRYDSAIDLDKEKQVEI
jgi:phosphatidylserine/phosphatidylglycerophosphate/cardiolipin synthase-like enzyme